VGAKVMLLDNFIVEYKLMNGSVGVVKELSFSNPEGTPDEKMYVVVDFPDSTVPDEQKLIPDKPASYVPIPLVTRRCEKKCCSMIPLQVCKALSIHKSQGMTEGEGKQFKKVIVHLPLNGNKCPGQELVATSRAVKLMGIH
jgi:ATP-dependent exoDNAse (exonuclease V) alpha subunit